MTRKREFLDYVAELGRFATMFRSPPGREEYEVLYVDDPSETWR